MSTLEKIKDFLNGLSMSTLESSIIYATVDNRIVDDNAIIVDDITALDYMGIIIDVYMKRRSNGR